MSSKIKKILVSQPKPTSDKSPYFEIAEKPMVYSRRVTWKDGHESVQGNLERPYLLFDEDGKPTHLFCASGNASVPYDFRDNTFILCMTLEKA